MQQAYDKVLKIITHLLHLVACLQTAEEDKEHFIEIRRRIHTVVHVVDPRTTAGDSLLHLSVMKNNTLRSQNLFEEAKQAFFPSVQVTKLLVQCGAKINALNMTDTTPLHTASLPQNYRQGFSLVSGVVIVVEVLLSVVVVFVVVLVVRKNNRKH